MTEELKKQGIVDGAAVVETVEETGVAPDLDEAAKRRSARLAAKRSTRKTNVPRTSAPAPRQSVCATWTTKTRTRRSGYLGDGAPPVE